MAREKFATTPANYARAKTLLEMAEKRAGKDLDISFLKIQMRPGYWEGRVWPEKPITLEEAAKTFGGALNGPISKTLVESKIPGDLVPHSSVRLVAATLSMLTGGEVVNQMAKIVTKHREITAKERKPKDASAPAATPAPVKA